MLMARGLFSKLVTSIDQDPDSPALESSPEYFLLFDGVSIEIEAEQAFSQLIKAEPRIDESSQGHVPTAAIERLEVSNSGHLFCWAGVSGPSIAS
jgi:hypothetical protein